MNRALPPGDRGNRSADHGPGIRTCKDCAWHWQIGPAELRLIKEARKRRTGL